MKYNELLDILEEEFKKATPAKFKSPEEAIKVVTSALKYLVSKCEKDDVKSD